MEGGGGLGQSISEFLDQRIVCDSIRLILTPLKKTFKATVI